MIWLRNLKKVKEELRSERWPRSAQEGFYTGTVLMAHALEEIRKSIKMRMPGASDTRIELEFSRMLISFNKMDERWIRKHKLDVDVMLPRDEHDKESLKKRKRKKIGNKMVCIIAPEDFVLQKLKVGRPRDFEDAVTVLERQSGNIGIPYLKKWANRLGIFDELNYILNL